MRSPLLGGAALAIAAIVAGCVDSTDATLAASKGQRRFADGPRRGGHGREDRPADSAGASGTVRVWVSFDQDSLAQHRAKLAAAATSGSGCSQERE
ncbi:MAG: hypothetical protein U1F49_07775 [Rubrivivax sp.]